MAAVIGVELLGERGIHPIGGIASGVLVNEYGVGPGQAVLGVGLEYTRLYVDARLPVGAYGLNYIEVAAVKPRVGPGPVVGCSYSAIVQGEVETTDFLGILPRNPIDVDGIVVLPHEEVEVGAQFPHDVSRNLKAAVLNGTDVRVEIGGFITDHVLTNLQKRHK